MRTSARRLLFLSGTLTLVICAVFYTKSRQNGLNSQLAAGDSTVLQVTWTNSSPSEQEALPVEPACSLRKGVRKDVLLKDQFQFSVPVLQWAGSLSAKTWKELKNRAPPYGWRGLPVDVLGSALLLLNSSHLLDRGSPDRCVRCAVVGNGGILRGSRRGRDIDNHDLVFRMNGAITEGFEEDVGTKISFYGFTTNSMKNALRLYGADGLTRIPQHPDIKYIFIPSDLRDYVMMAAAVHGQTVDSGEDEGDRPAEYFGHKPPETFKMLHPQFISYLTNSFLSSPLMTNIRTRHLYMPSTGALMLLTALHTCDQVSAYGFISRNYAEFSEHYYDSGRRPLKFYSNHDLLMESQLWELLHRRRLLRLLLRRSPQE